MLLISESHTISEPITETGKYIGDLSKEKPHHIFQIYISCWTPKQFVWLWEPILFFFMCVSSEKPPWTLFSLKLGGIFGRCWDTSASHFHGRQRERVYVSYMLIEGTNLWQGDELSSGDLMYNVVKIVNDIVLYTSKVLERVNLKYSHHRKRNNHSAI